jgi:catechol 2,3-dioxygenase-like lactoylglutathione lyase family enzyme
MPDMSGIKPDLQQDDGQLDSATRRVDAWAGRALSPGMKPHLAHVALLVQDYDEAIAWFTKKLGFSLREDAPRGPGKRWVLVAPEGGGTALLLAKAATPEQAEAVGRQGGGRVMFFLHTDDFARDYAAMRAAGVKFHEAPRHESYGTVAVFEDLHGNKWDLLQPTGPGNMSLNR